MSSCSQVGDGDLRRYLPDILDGIGSVRAYERLEGGTYNTGIGVSLEGGLDVVVKISPPSSAPRLSYEIGLLPTEADYFRRTRPFGVPVPEVLAAGANVIPGRDHLVMSKLPGRPLPQCSPRPTATERGELRRQLGRAVARAHQAPCRGFGYQFGRDQLTGNTWPDAFAAMMGALLDDAATYGVTLPRSADVIRELVEAHRPALAEVESPVLVHFDLWDGNVLVADGPELAGIVDGERALHGDPVFELPSLSVSGNDDEFVVDEAFLSGYAGVAGPLVVTAALRDRLALYRMYLYLVMLVEMVPRAFGAEVRERRRRECSAIVRRQLDHLQAKRSPT